MESGIEISHVLELWRSISSELLFNFRMLTVCTVSREWALLLSLVP